MVVVGAGAVVVVDFAAVVGVDLGATVVVVVVVVVVAGDALGLLFDFDDEVLAPMIVKRRTTTINQAHHFL